MKYKRGDIYLNHERPEPKHMFVVACDHIASVVANPSRILDVGGASGDFAAYASERFPEAEVAVLEYDTTLVEQGRAAFPGITFFIGDANAMDAIANCYSNATIMLGVHSVFDDFRTSFEECIRVTANGGIIVVIDIFNEYPVDALIYWRHAANGDEEFTRGHNLVSKATTSKFLDAHSRVASHKFEPFMVPFDLPQRSDPMRSWTEVDANGNKHFMDGLMPLNIQILAIRLKAN